MRIKVQWVVGTFGAVLLLGACGSKNPDSLVGMNLDENAAAMNAEVSADALAAVASAPANTAAPPADLSDRSGGAGDGTATRADAREAQRPDRPTEVNAIEPQPDTAPDEEPSIANQPENADGAGNAD